MLTKSYSSLIVITFLWLAATFGCSKLRAETEVVFLNLGAPLSTPRAQISGMAWCQDKLLLLPQKPEFNNIDSDGGYQLFTLEKADIEKAIADPTVLLKPTPVDLLDQPLRAKINEFDGYEAVVCRGNRFWFAIETKVDNHHFTTTLVAASGDLSAPQPSIKLADEPLSVIQSQSGIWNFSEETLVLDGDSLLAIHEANSTIEQPYAVSVDIDNATQTRVDFPRIPYRLTDATTMIDKRFWVINYLWADLEVMKGYPDPIGMRHPPSGTHLDSPSVERLLELELNNGAIEFTNTPPIYLQLTNKKGRNWEGIVRMGDQGFLLVTDEHPKTLLGFVPF